MRLGVKRSQILFFPKFCCIAEPNGRIRKDEIHVEDNILLWGHRLIILEILKKSLLKELHTSHFGIVKMKLLARSYLWWPSLNADIEKISKDCDQCQKMQANSPKACLQGWPMPDGIWSRIHIDFFGPINKMYFLIVLDAYSKWLEVFPMTSITSNMTIIKLRELFARYGLVKQIVSDNGPQLTSDEFKHFTQKNGIDHVTIPPYSPHCNGAAENSVKTVKTFLLKELDTKNLHLSLDKFLLIYRNTEHCSLAKDYRGIKSSWCRAEVLKILGKNVYLVAPLDNTLLSWKRHTNQIKKLYNQNFVNPNIDVCKDDLVNNSGGDKVNASEPDQDEIYEISDESDYDEPIDEHIGIYDLPGTSGRPQRHRKAPDRFSMC
ncbi:hypothetical protein NQ315_002859 [Exocentrus adspersus]|uniref:RNA-directed DNA polymerase n=1 Tax=Exocentrus adspersus TaxID=1586481 RepID=A0AAV8V950_9CUCU|nr:hypothetical protein NQ315_002859 [Exocentrus adspersus]